MTQAEKIKEAQQANLLKFAKERDLFKVNPELKEAKESLTGEIHRILIDMDLTNTVITDLKTHLKEETDALKHLEELKHIYAQRAYDLQNKGIFWADKEFIVKKPTEPKIDQQAMFNTLTAEQQEKYITRTKVMIEKEEVIINWEKLIKEEPILYTKTNPQLAHKPKAKKNESGDFDDE